MLVLLVSVILAILPLAGIAALIWVEPALTVGNLFTSLMLLTISGLFGLNVLVELGERRRVKKAGFPPFPKAGKGGTPTSGKVVVMPPGKMKERGVVEQVAYFESRVGHSNRSVVTLRNGTGPRLLVFKGDVRDQFPLGRQVEVVYSEDKEGSDLLQRKLA